MCSSSSDTISLEVAIAVDEDTKQDDARKLVAEANKTLARLQRERLSTLSNACLPAYGRLWTTNLRAADRRSAFSVDPTTLSLLAGPFDENDFVDSSKAEELDRIAQSFAEQLRLHRKRLQNAFDVFLCHNSEDKGEVKSIAAQLKRRGLLPWLDEEEIRPGDTWQSRVQQDIELIRSCAVIVGKAGIGPWQNHEIQTILQLFVERKHAVIPVILPSCQSVPELPIFLRNFAWVDYRTLDPDPLEQLIWGIGERRLAS